MTPEQWNAKAQEIRERNRMLEIKEQKRLNKQKAAQALAEMRARKNRVPDDCFHCPNFRPSQSQNDPAECMVNKTLIADCAVFRMLKARGEA